MYLRWIICIVFILSGCSSVPRPTMYKYTTQKHMQATQHWDKLARVTLQKFFSSQGCPTLIPPAEPVYVSNSDKSPFGRAFRTFLVTELENHGFRVSFDPANPLKIGWAVQIVEYGSDREFNAFPGKYTMAWASAWSGFGVATASSELMGVLAGTMLNGLA